MIFSAHISIIFPIISLVIYPTICGRALGQLENLWVVYGYRAITFQKYCPLSWWCHQMETFSVLLAICVGNSPVTGEFPAQRPVTWSFDVFFDLRLNKWLSKQSWGRWFETPSCPLWRHCNVRKIHWPVMHFCITGVHWQFTLKEGQ